MRPQHLTKAGPGKNMRFSANEILESDPLLPEARNFRRKRIIDDKKNSSLPPTLPYVKPLLHVKNLKLNVTDADGEIHQNRALRQFRSRSYSYNCDMPVQIRDTESLSEIRKCFVPKTPINLNRASMGFTPKKTKRNRNEEASKEFIEKAKKTVNIIRQLQYNPLMHLPERPKSVMITQKPFILTQENRELLFNF